MIWSFYTIDLTLKFSSFSQSKYMEGEMLKHRRYTQQLLFVWQHAIIWIQITFTTNLYQPLITFSTTARGQHLLLYESMGREIIQFPLKPAMPKTCELAIVTLLKILTKPQWKSTTLQLTPPGYSSSIIAPFFSGKAKSLPVCVFEASKWTAETERKKKIQCGPVKEWEKNQTNEPMPKEKPK